MTYSSLASCVPQLKVCAALKSKSASPDNNAILILDVFNAVHVQLLELDVLPFELKVLPRRSPLLLGLLIDTSMIPLVHFHGMAVS